MTAIINKIFQVFVDFVIGVAIYFGLNALIPILSDNAIAVIALTVTAVFAEFVEVKIKK